MSRNHHKSMATSINVNVEVSPVICQGLALPLPFPVLAGRPRKPDEEGGAGPPPRGGRSLAQQLPAVHRPSAGEPDGGVSRLPERSPVDEGQNWKEKGRKKCFLFTNARSISLFSSSCLLRGHSWKVCCLFPVGWLFGQVNGHWEGAQKEEMETKKKKLFEGVTFALPRLPFAHTHTTKRFVPAFLVGNVTSK